MPVDKPSQVRAVVSFDDKTIGDTQSEAKKDRDIQDSIKKAAWSAFVAACVYALVAAYQSCEFREANRTSRETLTAVQRAFVVFSEKIDQKEDYGFPDLGDLKTQLIVLGPKKKTSSQAIPIKPDVIDGVRKGTMHLYFYGWARYNDVFVGTPQHITLFCYELAQISWKGGPLPDPATFSDFFNSCPKHNCADDECKGEKIN